MCLVLHNDDSRKKSRQGTVGLEEWLGLGSVGIFVDLILWLINKIL